MVFFSCCYSNLPNNLPFLTAEGQDTVCWATVCHHQNRPKLGSHAVFSAFRCPKFNQRQAYSTCAPHWTLRLPSPASHSHAVVWASRRGSAHVWRTVVSMFPVRPVACGTEPPPRMSCVYTRSNVSVPLNQRADQLVGGGARDALEAAPRSLVVMGTGPLGHWALWFGAPESPPPPRSAVWSHASCSLVSSIPPPAPRFAPHAQMSACSWQPPTQPKMTRSGTGRTRRTLGAVGGISTSHSFIVFFLLFSLHECPQRLAITHSCIESAVFTLSDGTPNLVSLTDGTPNSENVTHRTPNNKNITYRTPNKNITHGTSNKGNLTNGTHNSENSKTRTPHNGNFRNITYNYGNLRNEIHRSWNFRSGTPDMMNIAHITPNNINITNSTNKNQTRTLKCNSQQCELHK